MAAVWYRESTSYASQNVLTPTAPCMHFHILLKSWLTDHSEGIQVANSQGWLSAPASVDGVSDSAAAASGGTTCNKISGASLGPFQTQMGSGSDDGAYVHVGVQEAGFAGFKNPSTVNFNNPFPEGVYWAVIDCDGIDDYV